MNMSFIKYVEGRLGIDVLLITCGLPGTFKTETSEEIAKLKGYPIVRTDIVRKEVLKGEDIFDEKVASNMDKRLLVYEETFREADELIEKEDSVIIDATFINQSLRRQAAAIANKYGKTFVILKTNCPEEVSIARIIKRTKENYESNALDEKAYLNNKNKFEEVDLDDLKTIYPSLNIVLLTVDTSKDLPEDWNIIGEIKR